jgi:hypothetical protein
MNDFSEMQHGLGCLQDAWISDAGIRLQQWLDTAIPGLKDELVATFDSHADGIRAATFMISLSEHDDNEDELGRLSMWRAYGRRSGVAIVMNPAIFNTNTDELAAYSAPVSYLSVAQFDERFTAFVDRLISHEQLLQHASKEDLLSAFFYTFRLFVLCTKHPGFHEEREWRVFHSPLIDGNSEWLTKSQEIIGGVPQEVCKLSLRNDVSRQLLGRDPSELIDRIIIGPSEYPVPTYHAFFELLRSSGIEDPTGRIWMSEIPLRN